MTLYRVAGRRHGKAAEYYILASTLLDVALVAGELMFTIELIQVLTEDPIIAKTRDERVGF